MNNYVFMTDTDSDLPYTLRDEYDIPVVAMPYALNGVEYFDDLGRSHGQKDFFDKMREGASASTSLLTKEAYLEYFEPILKENDLLFIAFSSEMSSTIHNIFAAREELLEKYPQRKFMVVDTLSISMPMSLLVLKAHEMYREGKPMEEVAQWVEDNKMRCHGVFTVDDLKYLKRGGRISSTAALMGTMLDLKPVLVEGKNGKIMAAEKVQGRKKALRTVAERTAQLIENPEEQTLYIIHADALEDAQRLEGLIRKSVPTIGNIVINWIGPVIGAHCGPGTVASCFMGKERTL